MCVSIVFIYILLIWIFQTLTRIKNDIDQIKKQTKPKEEVTIMWDSKNQCWRKFDGKITDASNIDMNKGTVIKGSNLQ